MTDIQKEFLNYIKNISESQRIQTELDVLTRYLDTADNEQISTDGYLELYRKQLELELQQYRLGQKIVEFQLKELKRD